MVTDNSANQIQSIKAILQFRASPGFRKHLATSKPDDVDVVIVDEADKATFQAEMLDADVLLHVLEPVTKEVIDAAPKLKLIQKIGVGVNTIDLQSALKRDIKVANMPGANSQAVAEMTLALMLATLRQINVMDRAVKDGQGWSLNEATFDRMGEINGRTVGLIGYGQVPQRLAPVLIALGAHVIYTSRHAAIDAPCQFVSFDELLAQSDIISLHIPLSAETKNIIDAASIARMKPGVILINTARGGLIEEPALLIGLTTRSVAAAGLDTLAVEPASVDNPLLALDNVVITPHIAWLTGETLARSLGIAFDNCRRISRGEPLLHQIDLQSN